MRRFSGGLVEKILCLLAGTVFILIIPPQDGNANPGMPADLSSYDSVMGELGLTATIEDPREREQSLDRLWKLLQGENRIPLIEGGRVAFLLRVPARSVSVAGDFNGWDPVQSPARRLHDSDVWIYEASFPLDARLDYKFVIDENDWRLDPDNPLQQLGGFGPNSELRMPEYHPSQWVQRRPETARGSLAGPRTIQSKNLGYAVRYAVYLPPDYDSLSKLPAIYVTDGHEYAMDSMGSMIVVLDELIAARRIQPLIAVFIDPRVNGHNRRSDQYILSPNFAEFIVEELVPRVDADHATSTGREDRAILGTSLGGLNSAWIGYSQPESFGIIVMQSPAFHAGNGQILNLYSESPPQDLRMYMSWGTFHDFGEHTERMLRILESKGYELTTATRNEGHSWGQWRGLLDDILIHFWGTE